jgi:hypothetical protein
VLPIDLGGVVEEMLVLLDVQRTAVAELSRVPLALRRDGEQP